LICVGAGKSSTFNLLLGTDLAKVDSSPVGVTQEVQWAQVLEGDDGKVYKIYDSPGLSEGAHGTTPGFVPKNLLETLVKQRSSDGGEGISAFLMVINSTSKVTSSTSKCYEYLHTLRGNDASAVPIIAVLTYVDDAKNKDQVKADYQKTFEDSGMKFATIIPGCTAAVKTGGIIEEQFIILARGEMRTSILAALSELSNSPGWKPRSWISRLKDVTPSVLTIAGAALVSAMIISLK